MLPVLKIHSSCISCGNCKLICPEKAIVKVNNKYVIETWSCSLCHLCTEICPIDCIKLQEPSKEEVTNENSYI